MSKIGGISGGGAPQNQPPEGRKSVGQLGNRKIRVLDKPLGLDAQVGAVLGEKNQEIKARLAESSQYAKTTQTAIERFPRLPT